MSENIENAGASEEDLAYQALKEIRESLHAMVAQVPGAAGEGARAILEFRTALTSETDRGSVLMAAAFIDDRLKYLLMARLVDDAKIARRAFEFNGPLGTFSSRIDFSYLMGILPKNAQRDLHIIRSIRNKFAHNAAPMTFEDESIKSLCNSLVFHGVKPMSLYASVATTVVT
ncbi:hypothetical protein [Paraburkholderia elongata]|uniref:Mannitol repressor n=1 Tax=Paraburkholderia elongata TaxID=2675747 RepID=A0A972SL93_9BURK|nr:hypothetical protein [Paraburkholderia elongata]NPT57580.1 hypothetical protein [Paraburkholderia elongata]